MTPSPPPRLNVRPEALQDVADAADWYERRQPGLGLALVGEVNATFMDIVISPRRFPGVRRRPEVRRALIQRFPYRVFYVRRVDEIIVIRVLHEARHDREWKSSLSRND